MISYHDNFILDVTRDDAHNVPYGCHLGFNCPATMSYGLLRHESSLTMVNKPNYTSLLTILDLFEEHFGVVPGDGYAGNEGNISGLLTCAVFIRRIAWCGRIPWVLRQILHRTTLDRVRVEARSIWVAESEYSGDMVIINSQIHTVHNHCPQ